MLTFAALNVTLFFIWVYFKRTNLTSSWIYFDAIFMRIFVEFLLSKVDLGKEWGIFFWHMGFLIDPLIPKIFFFHRINPLDFILLVRQEQ